MEPRTSDVTVLGFLRRSCPSEQNVRVMLAAVGGGNTAAEEGLFLTKFASKVTLVVRGGEFSASKVLIEKVRSHSKIEIRYRTVVKEFLGNGMLTSVVVRNTNTGEEETLRPAGVFVFIGMEPNTHFVRTQGLSMALTLIRRLLFSAPPRAVAAASLAAFSPE